MANYDELILDIEKLIEKNRVRGVSFMIFNDEEVLFSKQIGLAEKIKNSENKKEIRSITSSTKFMLGNMAKILTTIAIMQLVEKKEISLDADIKEYLPEFQIKTRFDETSITVRDILQNRSGLPCCNFEYEYGNDEINENELLSYFKEQYLVAPPKMMDTPSELGYAILKIIIEKKSGKKFVSYLEENIFKPLSINAIIINGIEDYEIHKNELALIDENLLKLDFNFVGRISSANNSIFISIDDFFKIVQLFLKTNFTENDILNKESIDEILKEPSFEDYIEGTLKTGLGVNINFDYIKTFGKVVSFKNDFRYHESCMMLIPEKKIGAIVFVNSVNTSISEEICVALLKNELDINYGVERRKRQITYVNCRIEDYAGYYPMYDKQIEVYLGDFLTMKIGNEAYKMQLKEDGYFDLFEINTKKLFFQKEKLEKNALIKNGFLTLIDFEDDAVRTDLVGYYSKPNKIDEVWKKALGEYKLSSSRKYNNIVSDRMELTIENDFLIMKFSVYGKERKVTLINLNSQESIALGYGKYSNETVFLNLSTVKYCGISYDKVKESPLNKVKVKKVNEEKINKKLKQKKIDKMFDIKGKK